MVTYANISCMQQAQNRDNYSVESSNYIDVGTIQNKDEDFSSFQIKTLNS